MSRAECLALEVAIMMSERQDVGRGVEEVVALRDADRLQRRADRAGAAEQQRRAARSAAGLQRAKMTSATAIRPWPDDRPWFHEPG